MRSSRRSRPGHRIAAVACACGLAATAWPPGLRAQPATHTLRATADTVKWGYFDPASPPVLTIASGERVLLLVTGHERKGDPPLERGRIRAAVHDWLAVSRHAPRIAAVRAAHRRHGGGGSLYIILRKK